MVDADDVRDVVVLIDVAYKYTPIMIEVWMIVTMAITMLLGKMIFRTNNNNNLNYDDDTMKIVIIRIIIMIMIMLLLKFDLLR